MHIHPTANTCNQCSLVVAKVTVNLTESGASRYRRQAIVCRWNNGGGCSEPAWRSGAEESGYEPVYLSGIRLC